MNSKFIWNVGGAISLTDSSIYMHVAYNHQCALCGTQMYKNIYKSSTGVTKHDTLFTGNSIGYNIVDYYDRNLCSNCIGEVVIEPAAIEMSAISGWYNKGSYNGANGTVRTEFVHTFSNKSISITPSISAPPAAVSFSISGATTSEYEKAWVYCIVSPN